MGVGVLNNYIYVVGGLESPSCNGAAALTRYQCVERYFYIIKSSHVQGKKL